MTSAVPAFEFPPGAGNAIAFVAWYSTFLAIQIGLALLYPKRWTWSMSSAIICFLILEVLGSVAYLKLSSVPFTGTWYSLFVAALTLGPSFFAITLHFCVHRALNTVAHVEPSKLLGFALRPSPHSYLRICLSLEGLSLLLQIIGVAYAGAKSRHSATAGQPGFDVVVAAMAIELISLSILLMAAADVAYVVTCPDKTRARVRESQNDVSRNAPRLVTAVKRPRAFRAFLGGVIANGLMLWARDVIRAVMSAGGVDSAAMGAPPLVNSEAILLFVAILVFTILHPVWTTTCIDRMDESASG